MLMMLAMMTITITMAMQSNEWWIPNVGAIKYFINNKGCNHHLFYFHKNQNGVPGVYTRVSHYNQWINDMMAAT